MSMTDNTDNPRAEFTRRRNYGLKARHAKRLARWEGVDSWLTRWEEAEDPHGQYGNCGRNPENIINLKDVS